MPLTNSGCLLEGLSDLQNAEIIAVVQRILHARAALDIVQPNICLYGGLMEMKKIAAMAEAHYVMVALHNSIGPVATTVNVHFAASTPNFLILEYTLTTAHLARTC